MRNSTKSRLRQATRAHEFVSTGSRSAFEELRQFPSGGYSTTDRTLVSRLRRSTVALLTYCDLFCCYICYGSAGVHFMLGTKRARLALIACSVVFGSSKQGDSTPSTNSAHLPLASSLCFFMATAEEWRVLYDSQLLLLAEIL